MSEQNFYRWKSKYGGMEVSEAKRLRELESENARLKKLLAEAELDKAMLEDVAGKKNGRSAIQKARSELPSPTLLG